MFDKSGCFSYILYKFVNLGENTMKKQLYVGISLVSASLLMSLAACGDDSSSGTDSKAVTPDFEVQTFDELGLCAKTAEGTVGFVKDDQASYTCKSGEWVKNDENSSSKDNDSKDSDNDGGKTSSSDDGDSSGNESGAKVYCDISDGLWIVEKEGDDYRQFYEWTEDGDSINIYRMRVASDYKSADLCKQYASGGICEGGKHWQKFATNTVVIDDKTLKDIKAECTDEKDLEIKANASEPESSSSEAKENKCDFEKTDNTWVVEGNIAGMMDEKITYTWSGSTLTIVTETRTNMFMESACQESAAEEENAKCEGSILVTSEEETEDDADRDEWFETAKSSSFCG